eukprot:SAG11_NODE_1549_length_4701_cov_1.707518_4_plen_66_part_00
MDVVRVLITIVSRADVFDTDDVLAVAHVRSKPTKHPTHAARHRSVVSEAARDATSSARGHRPIDE